MNEAEGKMLFNDFYINQFEPFGKKSILVVYFAIIKEK